MWASELAAELNAAENKDRAGIMAVYQKQTGFSKAYIYRVAKKNGFASERDTRSDKGISKAGITEDQIEYVSGLICTTGRENKGPIMPVEEALEIAIDNGIIERGQIGVDHFTALLRERQLSKERMNDPTPHTELRSLHPNYCHLVDVSVCIQYYLKNGKFGIMDERDFYKNKPDPFAKIKQKLLRYVLVDHFSGSFVWRYYIAEGETRENLWDFLKWSWRAKANQQFPFHGVPFYLLMDANSAQKSHALQNFFRGLQIILPKGKPYNPRRQGGVETVHNIIETRFETKLRICPTCSVEEINEWAFDYAIWYNATKIHTRHGMTRLASWLHIKPEQLRELPGDDVLNIIYTEPEVERPVRNYRLSYRGEDFNLKHLPGMHHNAKVMLSLNPYRWKTEQVITVFWRDTPYEVTAIRKLSGELGGFSEHAAIIGQEYKAQPETLTQMGKKRINEMAHGTQEPKKGSIPFEGTLVFGHQADKLGNLATIPKQGAPISIDRSIAPTRISITEFFRKLVDEIGPITPEMNRKLRDKHGESIESKVVGELIETIRETGNIGETGDYTIGRKVL